jgi:hypothetical protein
MRAKAQKEFAVDLIDVVKSRVMAHPGDWTCALLARVFDLHCPVLWLYGRQLWFARTHHINSPLPENATAHCNACTQVQEQNIHPL